MVKPIALCLERVVASGEVRYVRCTARPGREAGLSIACDGSIQWCQEGGCACELWVAHDQRLVALRPQGSPCVGIARAGRLLSIPEQHAVFLLDGDELVFDDFRYRVHVHGITDQLEPPRPLQVARGVAVASALALSLGCGAASDDSPAAGSAPQRVSATPGVTASVSSSGGAPAQPGFQVSSGGNFSVGDAGTAGTIQIIPTPPN